MPSHSSAADDHLSRLLPSAVEEPWYRSFIDNLRDTFYPPKLPPLELTSKPVAVRSIWGLYSPDRKSFLYSSGTVIAILVLLGTVFSSKAVQDQVRKVTSLVDPNISPYVPDLKIKKAASAGGGGGGDRSPLPASKGKLPKLSTRQFVPPQVVVANLNPKLTMTPTIVAPPDTPNINSAVLGDPLSKLAEASNGFGAGGGIGSGNRGGVGSGSGAGFGPGSGGGYGDGVYRVGGGVSAPQILHQVDPEYSEEARKAKYGGTVLLQLVVDAAGKVRDVRVVRSLGLGLDEKAIEAVNKWTFRPGMKNGQAVSVKATVEVNFRLL